MNNKIQRCIENYNLINKNSSTNLSAYCGNLTEDDIKKLDHLGFNVYKFGAATHCLSKKPHNYDKTFNVYTNQWEPTDPNYPGSPTRPYRR